MINDERSLILEEEFLIVRYSGEIPEVALHSTLDYLCNDPEGPGMLLCREELNLLYEAVRDRYMEIILRDLTPENRGLSMYRGVQRAMVNWQRLRTFCSRSDVEYDPLRQPVTEALLKLLALEVCECNGGGTVSAFNCSADELAGFLDTLQVPAESLPFGWRNICRNKE